MARNAVISGASTGIGRAIALHLDGLGFRVFAGVRRDADAEALRAAGSERMQPLLLDVTDAAGIATAVKTVEAAVGSEGIHGLVNNAGVPGGAIEEFVDLDAFRRLFEVNVFGVVALTRAFLPLVRRGQGRVVHMGSMGGFITSGFLTPYSASKFALEALADGLRRELRPWGLHVALIEPGSIATPIWEKGQSEAERMRADLPAEGLELYGEALDAFTSYIQETATRGVPPQRVADAVAHALTATRPRTRYRVGLDAKLTWWLTKLLPDRAVDAVLARVQKQPKPR